MKVMGKHHGNITEVEIIVEETWKYSSTKAGNIMEMAWKMHRINIEIVWSFKIYGSSVEMAWSFPGAGHLIIQHHTLFAVDSMIVLSNSNLDLRAN